MLARNDYTKGSKVYKLDYGLASINQNCIESRFINHDSYNSAGMLTKGLDKQISRISYNNIGLTDSIQFATKASVVPVPVAHNRAQKG